MGRRLRRLHSPSRDAIAALGFLLLAIFMFWLAVAQAIYIETIGYEPAASIPNFVRQVFTTPAGWMLIVVGNGIGFLFALAVLILSVVSFPLLLDRDVGAVEAVLTSVRAVAANPLPMAVWGLIVAGLLVIGSLPFFLGLAVVVPVLGHSTWHLYRKVVSGPNAHHEHPHPPKSRRWHYAHSFRPCSSAARSRQGHHRLNRCSTRQPVGGELHERAAQRSISLASSRERSSL